MLMLSLVSAGAQDGAFIAGGRSNSATVVAGPDLSRSDAAAARDLARYLEEITGHEVPVATSAEGIAGLRIHVGSSPYVEQQGLGSTGLFRDGYIIKLIDAENLVIVGGENLGTGFGVYDFLGRVCGVRWYMPGPLGEVVPRREQIVLDGLDIRSEPSVPSAWVRPIDIDNLKAKHFRRYHWAGHNMHRLIPPEQYGEEHPEYYPLVNGERRVPLGARFPWQPCVSNPELPVLVVGLAQEHFAQNPHSEVFSLGVNDGGGDCLCDECMALDRVRDGRRDMSDRYARFYNECADELGAAFPGKLLGFHAYGGAFHPPTRERLRENIYVRLTGGADMLQRVEEWSQAARQIGVYEYLYGRQILEPRHYPHVLGEYVKTLVDRYQIRSFSAEMSPFWPLDGPKTYVLLELLWDADQDVDALLDDYFGGLYAEAAEPMAQFFQRIEDVYRRRSDPLNFMDGFRRGGFGEWEMADLQQMDARIAEATAAAQDEDLKARVRMVADAYSHVRCWIAIHVLAGELAEMRMRDRTDAEKTVEVAREISRQLAEKAQWDARVLDVSLYPSQEYYDFYVARHYAEPGTLVQTIPQAENAIEAAFERVSAQVDGADGFWRTVAEAVAAEERIADMIATQRYLLAHDMNDPLSVLEDDFEAREGEQAALDAGVADQFRWEQRENLPEGYGVWSYTGRPANFVWTDRLARSGERCIGIERNEVQASILRTFDVKPGERYRVQVFATRLWERDDAGDVRPHLTVAWQGEGGWTTDPRITVAASAEESGAWEELTARVAVPSGASRMVVTLGIEGSQLGGGGTYFDDLRVSRLDPEAAQ